MAGSIARFVRLRNSGFFLTIILPAVVVVLATICIRIFDLAVHVQRGFWDADKSVWRYAEHPWVERIYNLGVLPALFVGLAALGVLLFGIGRMAFAQYRKIAGYLVLTLLVGSGLIANALLKGLWGRPRPSQLREFGGSQTFEPILVWMGESQGKSFPCGHATMGFFFFAVALAIPQRMKMARYFTAAFGLALGLALGWVRAAQGGHFLSDVVWSAAIMWFVAIVLFHALGLSDRRKYIPRQIFKREVPTWQFFCYAPVIALGMLLCLLGTPYKEIWKFPNALASASVKRVVVDIDGEVKVVKGEKFHIAARAEGFGVPNSSNKFQHRIDANGDLTIKDVRKGFFTELTSSVTITKPEDQTLEIVCKGASHLVEADAPHP